MISGIIFGLVVGYILALIIWIWSMAIWYGYGKTDDPSDYWSNPDPDTPNHIAILRLVKRSWIVIPFHPLPWFIGVGVYYGAEAINGNLTDQQVGMYIGVLLAIMYRFIWWYVIDSKEDINV
jgi:hypothetical protein